MFKNKNKKNIIYIGNIEKNINDNLKKDQFNNFLQTFKNFKSY